MFDARGHAQAPKITGSNNARVLAFIATPFIQ
jgi:hypothetical protein